MRFHIALSGLLLVSMSNMSTVDASLDLVVLGSYFEDTVGASAAEIVDYDPCEENMYVVNSNLDLIDVVNISDPAIPTKIAKLILTGPTFAGYEPTSVVVIKDLGAVATSNANPVETDPGVVAFFSSTPPFQLLRTIQVGANPDMITITPDGKYLLVANEGIPTQKCTTAPKINPKGTISVINLSNGINAAVTTTIDFTALDGASPLLPTAGIRIQNGVAPSIDLEPEYIAVSPDSKLAFVSLQENNAIAKIDLASTPPRLLDVFPMQLTDHSKIPLDPSDRDGIGSATTERIIAFRTLKNLYGMPMPDSIAAYEAPDGKRYVVTANEGDSRACIKDNGEEEDLDRLRFASLDTSAIFNPALFGAASPNDFTTLKNIKFFGRLEVSSSGGDFDNDGTQDGIVTFGTRSFSIYDENGEFVFDSGNQFEAFTSGLVYNAFNANVGGSGNVQFDDRSDSKGPEPEALAVGEVDGRFYAFIGLERTGGVIVYDITVPKESFFVTYVNGLKFGAASLGGAGDVAPEGIKFVDKDDSPTGNYMLLVANEVSGTVTIYDIVNLAGDSCKDDKKGDKKRSRDLAAGTASNEGGRRVRGELNDSKEGRQLTPGGKGEKQCKKKKEKRRQI
jgi:2',3'-cyclic-nucleotide 2'-phosphodiesterase/3'-nucleotidase/5'-nucleotidase